MTLGFVHGTDHLHLWTRSLDGNEYANALFTNEIDAAIAFTGIVVNIRKYATDGNNIAIEDVMQSLEQGRGMYAGFPGLVLVLSKCGGNCNSPTWN